MKKLKFKEGPTIHTRRFYKTEDGRWFIDEAEYIDQGGDIEDLEMMEGADVLLGMLSKDRSEVIVQFSDQPLPKSIHLLKEDEDSSGATYILLNGEIDLTVWVCNITLLYFDGVFPDNIWLKKIK